MQFSLFFQKSVILSEAKDSMFVVATTSLSGSSLLILHHAALALASESSAHAALARSKNSRVPIFSFSLRKRVGRFDVGR